MKYLGMAVIIITGYIATTNCTLKEGITRLVVAIFWVVGAFLMVEGGF